LRLLTLNVLFWNNYSKNVGEVFRVFFLKGDVMRVLSQCSFITSFVLVISLFDGLSAAKTPISLTHKFLNEISGAVKDVTHPSSVVGGLVALAQNHRTVLAYVAEAYNSLTEAEIPQSLVNEIPKPILAIIGTEKNGKYSINGAVFKAVGTLMESIGGQIIAAKGGNTRKCCGGWKCCGVYCCGNPPAPSVLKATAGLLFTVLLDVGEAYFTRGEGSDAIPDAISIDIPNEHISFGYEG
jgi:hypothetical protein